MDPKVSPTPPSTSLPDGANQTPYDFIVNQDANNKHTATYSKRNNTSTAKRVIFVLGGGTILILIAVIFYSFLGSANKGSAQTLLSLAQQQHEIIRVAGLGLVEPTATPDTKNLAITTQLSMQSSQTAILKLIRGKSVKSLTKSLGIKKNPQTDAQLTLAAQNGVYNKTFVQILDTELGTYSNSLQAVFLSTKSASQKQVLQNSFNGVSLLLNDAAVKNQ
jgi:hypothetical protein